MYFDNDTSSLCIIRCIAGCLKHALDPASVMFLQPEAVLIWRIILTSCIGSQPLAVDNVFKIITITCVSYNTSNLH